MQISYNSMFKFFLFLFLLNSAGILSPSFSLRGEDWEATRAISSNSINRIIMLLSWGIGTFLVFKSDTKKINILFIGSWSLISLMIFALSSIIWSDLPLVSFMRFLQQIFLFTFLFAISLKLDSEDHLNVLIYIAMFIVSIGFFTLLIPGAWQDIGYRGIHGHKNTAGYLYALSAIILFYAIKIQRFKGSILTILFSISLLLLLLTKSKTSFSLAIFCIILIHFCRHITTLNKYKILVSIWATCIVIYSLFLIIPAETFEELGVNLTGRFIIWQFAISELTGREIFGVGYRAFWGVGEGGISVMYGEDYDAFITQLNQVHNSYMDIWIMLGWVGLSFFSIFVATTFKIISKSNDLYFGILAFLTIHSFMETDFFRSNNFLWVIYVLIYFSSIINQRDKNAV